MFRPIRRINQEISKEKCIEILKNEIRGTIAVHGENGYPYAFPMNYIYIDEKLYFHSAKEGHKIDAIAQNNKVSYCVIDKGEVSSDGWSMNFNSIIIFGTMNLVTNEEKTTNYVRKLAEKNYPPNDEIERILKNHKGHFYVYELTIDHITGKLVNES